MGCLARKALAVTVLTAAALIRIPLLPYGALAQVATPISTLTHAYNASGQELLKEFSGSPGNIVFSPYSIGSAMSMALSGARAETEREMLSVLKHHLTRQEIEAANSQALTTFKNYDKSAVTPTCPAGMELEGQRCRTSPSADGWCPPPMKREGDQCFGGATLAPSAKLLVANALMMIRSESISPEYAALLKDQYAAEVFQKATLSDINRWVSRKTEGKIPKMLDQLDDTAAVLLNAVYFKSRWASPFDERDTKNDAFSLSSGQQAKVAMMNQTHQYAVVARQGYRAIRLPYAVRTLSMVIALPNEVDGLGAVVAQTDAKEQSEMIASLRNSPTKPVALLLPRFKTEFKAGLVPLYRQAGMKLAFDPERADFSGITGKPASEDRLFIGGILHRAMIEVSEESTEAAAATAISMVATGLPRKPEVPEVFRVDRPFLFSIVDDATGAILFTGRISDPLQMLASR